MTTEPDETPLTIPVPLTIATALLLLVQVPPDTVCSKVTDDPGQSDAVPEMLPAEGLELMETSQFATAVPHEFDTEYLMVSRPASTPVTVPATETLALPFDAVQMPPETVSDRVMAAPAQTDDGPEMIPAFGAILIVMILDADTDPHDPVTVYKTVSVPVDNPVTTPAATDACALTVLQTPPATVSVRVTVPPMQTPDGPEILPAASAAPTATMRLVVAVPQPLVTV